MAESGSPQQRCREELQTVASVVGEALLDDGFRYLPGDVGTSSGGPFATGFLVHPAVRIGLIVRTNGLGGVVYEVEGVSTSHEGLLHELGIHQKAQLGFDSDRMVSVAKDAGDPVEALVADLVDLVLPMLRLNPDQIADAIEEGAS